MRERWGAPLGTGWARDMQGDGAGRWAARDGKCAALVRLARWLLTLCASSAARVQNQGNFVMIGIYLVLIMRVCVPNILWVNAGNTALPTMCRLQSRIFPGAKGARHRGQGAGRWGAGLRHAPGGALQKAGAPCVVRHGGAARGGGGKGGREDSPCGLGALGGSSGIYADIKFLSSELFITLSPLCKIIGKGRGY